MTTDTTAKLMKWPSLNGERISPKDGAAPYTIMHGSLRDCVDALRAKPQASHKLYEVHTGDGAIMSAAEALALVPARENHPPPEEDYGGGASCPWSGSHQRATINHWSEGAEPRWIN